MTNSVPAAPVPPPRRRHPRRLVVWRIIWLSLFLLGLFLFIRGYQARQYRETIPDEARARSLAQRFHKVVEQRMEKGRALAEKVVDYRPAPLGVNLLEYCEQDIIPPLRTDHLELLVARQDSIILWTLRYGADTWTQLQELGEGYIHLYGRWYYVRHYDFPDHRAYVLANIRSDYPVENQYFTQTWDPSLSFLFSERVPPLEAECRDLFSYTERIERSWSDNRISVGFLLLFLALLAFPSLSPPTRRMLWSVLGSSFALGLHWFCKSNGWLVGEFGDFFTPKIFAISGWLSSFADLFYYALFCLGVVLQVRWITPLEELSKPEGERSIGFAVAWLLGTTFLLQAFTSLVHQVVFNATITLTPYSFANMSPYALSVFFSLAVFGVSTALASIVAARLINHLPLWAKGLIWATVFLLDYFILHLHHSLSIGCVCFFSSPIFLIVAVLHWKKDFTLFTGYYILVALLFTGAVALVLDHTDAEKDRDVRDYIAESLTNERDLTLEFLFTHLTAKIKSDSTLIALANASEPDIEAINAYFRKRFHRDYLLEYDIQLTFCYPETNILIDQTALTNCQSFFSRMIYAHGTLLLGTNFYYLVNQNGRISYLGLFNFSDPAHGRRSTLYIELDSKLPHYYWGYPELLVDKKYARPAPLMGISSAIYLDNQLMSQTGDYHYPVQLLEDLLSLKEKETKLFDKLGYSHFVKRLNPHTVTIVSKPLLKPIELLGGIAYLGLIFIVVFNFILLPARVLNINSFFIYGLAGRIQRLILYMMLFYIPLSFISIQYVLRSSLQSDAVAHLQDKLAIVLNDLEASPSILPSLLHDSLFANWELTSLSNKLYCDINLYDTEGWLVGSSRAEIFRKHLLGGRIHVAAWNRLHCQYASQWVQNECIGGMDYASIYAPIYHGGKLTAYLNLPYFRSPSVVQHEYIHLVALILNVLLLFTCAKVFVMFHFTTQITRQLHVLRHGVENVSLANANRPLIYRGNDEIGALVTSYNRMLAQIAESAEDLAKNERENAWKEMARQIAHDIKNPLTPMKLGLQHLILMKQQGREDWDERFESYAKTLGDQIEALTQTADTFTRFATLTLGNAERTSVGVVLRSSLDLFRSHKEIAFKQSISLTDDTEVYIDPTNLQRVFNNLFTNAVQALHATPEPQICVTAAVENNWVRIHVADNGPGIDPAVRDKIFNVNFTTKSTGLGLGLAITANIVRSAGGSISFESVAGQGTTFTVALPLMLKLSSPVGS